MSEYYINGELAPEVEAVNAFFPAYDVQMIVGVGAAGAIYYAMKGTEPVAIKLLIGKVELRKMLEFEAEAKAMSVLNHPNIVKVYEHGVVENYPYIILEYIERGTLYEMQSEFSFTVPNIINIMIMLCDGVGHMHEKGYIHRDLKPDNVMFNTDWVPKVIDFGLTINLNDLSHFPTAEGSRGYAAPEVVNTPKEIDHRVDIFALGGILYSLLTRQIPNPENLDVKILKDYDVRFKMMITKAMHMDVEQRMENTDVFKQKLFNLSKSIELKQGE